VRPGTNGLYHAVLRERSHWVGGAPTLDVFSPNYTPYPSSYGSQLELGFAERDDGRQQHLSPAALLEFLEVLPRDDSIEVDPTASTHAVREWAERNPQHARAWPASDIIHMLLYMADEARIHLLAPPMAGTYRVVVTFATGDSSVLYARTESRAMSGIRGRRQEDVSKRNQPLIGYYFNAYVANSVRDLGGDESRLHYSYFAASLSPATQSRDSIVWHGELDPLVEITFLDRRAAVRTLARSLFGESEEVRDPSWYYMPGTWVSYSNGRVRYEWIGRRGSTLVYAVRAERLDLTTSSHHTR
jgi:hypothetical protein